MCDLRRADLFEQTLIILRLDEDGDARVVLGGGAHERRPPDVDHLHRLGQRRPVRDGLLEGIEIDHNQVEGLDRGLRQVARVVVPRLVGQNAAENPRVKRLDAPAEDLGEAQPHARRPRRKPGLGDHVQLHGQRL